MLICFAHACKRFTVFTDPFAFANRRSTDQFSSVCCRAATKLYDFIAEKLAKLLTVNVACVSVNISCLLCVW